MTPTVFAALTIWLKELIDIKVPTRPINNIK